MTTTSKAKPMTAAEWIADAVARTPSPSPKQLAEVRRSLAPTKTSETLSRAGAA